MLKSFWNKMVALHKDEGGADMVEYILLIAVIALPALGLVIVYRNKIVEWMNTLWTDITGQACASP